jgi:hypothetical protein
VTQILTVHRFLDEFLGLERGPNEKKAPLPKSTSIRKPSRLLRLHVMVEFTPTNGHPPAHACTLISLKDAAARLK